jgi:hypothetical protein
MAFKERGSKSHRSVPVMEVTVKFDRKNHLDYEVISAKVNNGESVTVHVDDDARNHYR